MKQIRKLSLEVPAFLKRKLQDANEKVDFTQTGIKPIVIDEIRALAERYQLRQVLLFGSRARGDFREKSDIDLAVRGAEVARFALDVDEETSALLMFDVVDLDGCVSDALREEIARDGQVIYEKI